eukprot:1159769-Pelagomonas_calceolata.AAC.2
MGDGMAKFCGQLQRLSAALGSCKGCTRRQANTNTPWGASNKQQVPCSPSCLPSLESAWAAPHAGLPLQELAPLGLYPTHLFAAAAAAAVPAALFGSVGMMLTAAAAAGVVESAEAPRGWAAGPAVSVAACVQPAAAGTAAVAAAAAACWGWAAAGCTCVCVCVSKCKHPVHASVCNAMIALQELPPASALAGMSVAHPRDACSTLQHTPGMSAAHSSTPQECPQHTPAHPRNVCSTLQHTLQHTSHTAVTLLYCIPSICHKCSQHAMAHARCVLRDAMHA